MKAAREAWEADEFKVFGLAPTGKAARSLEDSAGILSTTIHGFLNRLERDASTLLKDDVVVIDEAGLVDTRLMHTVMKAVQQAEAKLVLIGDSEQLQPVQAGGAYTLIKDAAGHVDLTTIRRQHEPWQRQATYDLGRGEVRQALLAYHRHGHIHVVDTTAEAKARVVQQVLDDRAAPGFGDKPGALIVLAHSNRDVAELNHAIRTSLKQRGALGPVMHYPTAEGALEIAQGERVIFRQNDAALEVQNGVLGTVVAVRPGALDVRLDDRARTVTVEQNRYRHLEYGYAMTIHKSQSVTAERVAALATRGLDKHLTYVALSRHRQSVEVYGGRDQFTSGRHFLQTLSRPRRKLSATAFAERHGLTVQTLLERVPVAPAAPAATPVTPPPSPSVQVEPAVEQPTVRPTSQTAEQPVPAPPPPARALAPAVPSSPPPPVSKPRPPPRRWATLAAVQAAIQQGDMTAVEGLSFRGQRRAVLTAIQRHAAAVKRWPPPTVARLLQERPAYREAERVYRIAEANHDCAVTQCERYARAHPIAARLAQRGFGEGAVYYRRERETEAAFKTAAAALTEQAALNQSPAWQEQAGVQVQQAVAQQRVAQAVLERLQPALEQAQRAAEQHRRLNPSWYRESELDLGPDD